MSRSLVLAPRESPLALWQANHIRDRLLERWGNEIEIELVKIVTAGDRILIEVLAFCANLCIRWQGRLGFGITPKGSYACCE